MAIIESLTQHISFEDDFQEIYGQELFSNCILGSPPSRG